MRTTSVDKDVRRKSQHKEKALVFGRVSKVWDKQSDDIDEGNIELNVLTRSQKNELRRVPLTHFDHSGHVSVPQEGDPIILDYASGRGRAPVAVASTHNEEDSHRAPNALEGHWRHEWPGESDNVYLEAEPGDGSGGMPDLVRMGIKPGGIQQPTTEVAVDNSGSSPQIRIETDGDIELNADGDILISTDSGTPTPVAKQNHTHDYEDTGDTDSGGSGSTTKTSTKPNEDPTETQIG